MLGRVPGSVGIHGHAAHRIFLQVLGWRVRMLVAAVARRVIVRRF
jgi:hypothetical protein